VSVSLLCMVRLVLFSPMNVRSPSMQAQILIHHQISNLNKMANEDTIKAALEEVANLKSPNYTTISKKKIINRLTLSCRARGVTVSRAVSTSTTKRYLNSKDNKQTDATVVGCGEAAQGGP
jgi:hypothetical protein